jgi:hypothetical protein
MQPCWQGSQRRPGIPYYLVLILVSAQRTHCPDGIVAAAQEEIGPFVNMVSAGAATTRDIVYEELDAIAVGIDFDFDNVVLSERKASAADIDHRLIGPVGFVPEEAVLLHAAVEGDHAFVVPARCIAFIARVHGEVKGHPDRLRPQERHTLRLLPIGFVEGVLILLWMPRADSN